MVGESKVVSPTAGRDTFPDSLKRLVSITKQIFCYYLTAFMSALSSTLIGALVKTKTTPQNTLCPHGRVPSTEE